MTQNNTETNGYAYQKGDAQLIAALASGKSQEEAAETAGLSRATVVRRLSDPAFRVEIRRIQSEVLEKAVGLLSGAAEEAVKTLQQLLKANGENVRLGAARAILDCVFRVREEASIGELNQRIDTLESLLNSVRQ